jgi:hypothetical protein
MADIGKLKGITDAEAEGLRKKCEVRTVEALWLRISNADDSAWKSLTDNSGIEKKRLIDLLAAEGRREPGFAGAWFNRHWLDVLILLIALALALGTWLRL